MKARDHSLMYVSLLWFHSKVFPSDKVPLGDRVPTRTCGGTRGHFWLARMAYTSSVSRLAHLHCPKPPNSSSSSPKVLPTSVMQARRSLTLLCCLFSRECVRMDNIVLFSPQFSPHFYVMFIILPYCLLLKSLLKND